MNDFSNSGSSLQGEAGVLIVTCKHTETAKERVLLTKRAITLSSHAGEVSLPGGMWEPGDFSLADTAARECLEETGLGWEQTKTFRKVGRDRSRRGVGVTAYFSELLHEPHLTLSEDETESSRWVPVDIFANDERIRTDIFRVDGQEYWAPVYRYEDYEIWGLTARLLVRFVQAVYGKQLTREHKTAPEVVFKR